MIAADWQVDFDERAAILQYDGGLERPEAEAQALAETYDAIVKSARICRGILGELIKVNNRRSHLDIAPIVERSGLHTSRAPAWGFDRVVVEANTYRPALPGEGGASALIVPACEDGTIVDLVAQGLTSGRMLPRMGIAAVLGADEIEMAREDERPLLIFANALSWLRGGCRGAVIIDWQQAGYSLNGIEAIHSPVLIAADIYKATRRCWPLPKIRVPEGEVRHAA